MTRPGAPQGLPRPVIDSHCHLDIAYDEESALSPAEALAAAVAVNVTRIMHVGCSRDDVEWAVEVAGKVPGIAASIGIHPNEAAILSGRGELDSALELVAKLAPAQQVRGIGETGLDYFRTQQSGRHAQLEAFRWHIALARDLGKALVIHDRDAHADVIATLREAQAGAGLPEVVIFHCFSGDAAMAQVCAENGWYVSFSGVVTFKNARDLHAAAQVVPSDRILVETDAPFLTPAPHRGKPNASYLVPLTVAALARLRDVEVGTLCDQLYANTERAFGTW